jgi:hypothetical protein
MNVTNPYDDIDLGSEPFRPETRGEALEIKLTEVRQVETKEDKEGVVLAGVDDHGIERDWVRGTCTTRPRSGARSRWSARG